MTRTLKTWTVKTATLGIACFLFPAVAHADAGVPMLAVLWPLSWIAFVPVVVIEA